MTDSHAKQLGDLVRRARQAKGITLLALEELSGFSESWLLRLEHGHYTEPNPVHLTRLAELLEIDPAAIDSVSQDHLANSLPLARTYHRSKYKLSDEALDEIEAAIADITARDAVADDGAAATAGRGSR